MAVPDYIPRYTAEEYRLWQGDWELWDGIPVSMSPSPDAAHQRAAGRLFRWVSDALAKSDCKHCQVYYELDWIVDANTVLRPDLVVVCGAQPVKFVDRAPRLVVEVLSESTRDRDLVHKRAIYERSEVAYYLTVDPHSKWRQLLRLEDDGSYRPVTGNTIQLSPRCTLNLEDLEDLEDLEAEVSQGERR